MHLEDADEQEHALPLVPPHGCTAVARLMQLQTPGLMCRQSNIWWLTDRSLVPVSRSAWCDR